MKLIENKMEIIFKFELLKPHSGSIIGKFKIQANGIIGGKGTVYYTLSRWDDRGGWNKIYQQNYDNMEIAKENLIPLAKYFTS